MKRSKEQRAQIARENGAKSNGPVTEQGKARSAQNGFRPEKLSLFSPPHAAALCTENRAQFNELLDQLLAVYRPFNPVAASVVRDIAVARWQILRLDTCITTRWNLSIIDNAQRPPAVAPELHELEIMDRSAEHLHVGDAVISRYNRDIDRLELRTARLERRLKFIHANFTSTLAPPRTQHEPTQSVETKEGETKQAQCGANPTTPAEQPAPASQEPQAPLYVTENTPAVIEFYRQNFPDREIVILPPDDVANGIDIEDDMPNAPRIAA